MASQITPGPASYSPSAGAEPRRDRSYRYCVRRHAERDGDNGAELYKGALVGEAVAVPAREAAASRGKIELVASPTAGSSVAFARAQKPPAEAAEMRAGCHYGDALPNWQGYRIV